MAAEVREVRKTDTKSTSSSGARNVCENCNNDWPASYGTKCYTCGHTPLTPDTLRRRTAPCTG